MRIPDRNRSSGAATLAVSCSIASIAGTGGDPAHDRDHAGAAGRGRSPALPPPRPSTTLGENRRPLGLRNGAFAAA